MTYRSEIDGMRGLAVLAVVFFHATIGPFKGGFVGVDIFFVISGYLITQLLIFEEKKTGSISLSHFYMRRARRILPGLYFVLCLSLPLAFTFLAPAELESFFKSLFAVPLFISNCFFAGDGGYFESSSELKPLLHTWSLAIEEQFYIFFPWVIFLTNGLTKKWRLFLLGSMSFGSFVLGQEIFALNTNKAFYSSFARFWEIGFGSLVALIPWKVHKTVECDLLSIVGLTMVLISVFVFNKTSLFPGLLVLLPVLGTGLILSFGTAQTITGKILRNKPLGVCGLMSYSLYLWHQPLFSFVRNSLGEPSTKTVAGLLVLLFAISWISWRFIEIPFRKKHTVNGKPFLILSIGLTGVLLVIGRLGNQVFGNDFSKKNDYFLAKQLVDKPVVFAPQNERIFNKWRVNFEQTNPDCIVLGSSRMMQIRDFHLGEKVLNLAVSRAILKDDIAMWEMSRSKFRPKRILIAADPWLFNASANWKSEVLMAEFQRGLQELVGNTAWIGEAEPETKAPGVWVDWVMKIYQSVNRNLAPPMDDVPEYRDKIRKDGSRVHNIGFSSRSQAAIEQRGLLLNYQMEPYERSAELKGWFLRFLDRYKDQYQIILVLAPYHPKAFEKIKKEKPVFLEIEKEFKQISKERSIQIIGSYNPSANNCKSDEFFDGLHPKESCMKKIIAKVRK